MAETHVVPSIDAKRLPDSTQFDGNEALVRSDGLPVPSDRHRVAVDHGHAESERKIKAAAARQRNVHHAPCQQEVVGS